MKTCSGVFWERLTKPSSQFANRTGYDPFHRFPSLAEHRDRIGFLVGFLEPSEAAHHREGVGVGILFGKKPSMAVRL